MGALLCFYGAGALTADAAIQLRVVDGDGATNGLGATSDKPLIVEVSDEFGRPVAGAAVVFKLPDSGPTGMFTTGQRTESVHSQPDGRATLSPIHWNDIAGVLRIRVTASKESERAGLLATQYLAAKVQSGSRLGIAAPIPSAVSVRPAVDADQTPIAVPRLTHSKPAQPETLAARASIGSPIEPAAPEAAAGHPAGSDYEPLIAGPLPSGTGTFRTTHHLGKKWIALGVVGGAAAGVFLATHSQTAKTGAPVQTVGIGAPIIIVGQHP